MSSLKIYNSMTRTEEEFVPRDANKVSIYACGLTAQGPPHIGHIRGAIIFDVIRRWFIELGYQVEMVQNFTDIDDKIIAKSETEGLSAEDVAKKYSTIYLNVLDTLNILPIHWCRVTEEMDSIIEMVQVLIDKGHAYAVDGDVYFKVSSFKEYGKLSGRNIEDVQSGYRIDVDERKQNAEDFALWKSAKPGEPSWDSPWGAGRPGWHIECSAMSLKFLGKGFDIHAGGNDLIFPHHENEIAQAEAYLDGQFAKYWVHWGSVTLGKEKMSKSLGNFLTAEEILAEFDPDILRMFLIGTDYRSPLDFSRERLAQTATAVTRMRTAYSRAHNIIADTSEQADEAYWSRFADAMNHDFNSASAIGIMFELVSEINKSVDENPDDVKRLAALSAALTKMAETLGFRNLLVEYSKVDSELTTILIEAAIRWRQLAREAKNWKISDAIRDDLKSHNIILQDGPSGTTWKIEVQ